MFDWTGLQAFLLTARMGSTLRAAKELRVNQTTVMRRIRQLETELGVSLFVRHQQGYRPTPDGAALLPMAEAMEKQAAALASKAMERRRNLSGKVRITTTELVATRLLPPILAELRLALPQAQVEVVATDSRLDLAKGEADIAIRAGGVAEDASIIRRKVADSVWSIYIGRALRDRMGEPNSEEDLGRYPIVIGEGFLEQAPPLVWLRAKAGEAQVAFRSNSLPGLVAATKAGIGLSVLPALAAGAEADLVRCSQLRSFSSPAWICIHDSRRQDQTLRSVMSFLADRIARLGHLLEGKSEDRRKAPRRRSRGKEDKDEDRQP